MKIKKNISLIKAIALLLVLTVTFRASGQNEIIVQGSVMSDKGEPLAAATISVKGETPITMADSLGKFTIMVKGAGSVIVVEHTGYQPYEQVVGINRELNVVLTSLVSDMENVVVIAYGTSSQKGVSNSLSSVTAKDIADKPVMNALQALQGSMSGVNIQQGTGAPGDEPQIKIRGMGSLSAGSQPLFVVDVLPLEDAMGFNQISPSDIERIDVLKDAASAAMYGSRAGNGVVLVTTKKGKKGDARFQVNSMFGIQEVSKYVKVLNKEQYVEYVKDAFNNANRAYPSLFDTPELLGNTDWQREIFEKAPMHNLEVSASGGTGKSNFFVSAYTMKQEGILKGTGFQRHGFRTNLNLDLKPWLKMGVNLAPSYSIKDVKPAAGSVNSASFDSDLGGSPLMGSPITLAILTPPVYPVYMPNGIDYASNYNWPVTGDLGLPFNGQHFNPLQILDLYQDKHKTFRTIGNMFVQVEPLKGLTIKTTLGGEVRADERFWLRPATLASSDYRTANITTPELKNKLSSLIKGFGYNWLIENTANYKATINGKHNIDAIIGYSAQKAYFEAISISGAAQEAKTDLVDYPTDFLTVNGGVTRYTENTMISSFGRIQYNYAYKYILTAALRRDGSSRFGIDNRYAAFPSASAAWNIAEEAFYKNGKIKTILSDLKLRASWGKTGNYSIGDFIVQGAMGSSNYIFGSGSTENVLAGYSQSSFVLNKLGWEQNEQFDMGLDFNLFRNRVSVTIDYYNRTSRGLLLSAPIPALAGFQTSVLKNIGDINNRGYEFAIHTKNFTGDFSWNTNFNITFNRNKIIALSGGTPITTDVPGYSSSIRHVVGGALGDFYGLNHIGVYMNAEDLANSPRWETSLRASQVGDIKYEDSDGDGQITTGDIRKIGSPQPKFFYGFINEFKYKNLDLNLVLQGVYGNKIANSVIRYSNTFLGGDNPLSYALDRWRSVDNPGNGMIPRAVAWAGTSTPEPLSAFSTYNLFDGSYLRINTVTLGYNLSKLIFGNDASKTARLYSTVQNVYTFSSYPGYNPDVNQFGRSDSRNTGGQFAAPRLGVDQGAYPLPRTYVIGLNIGF